MPDAPHTLSRIDDDLDQLRAMVSEMGGRVETSIQEAVAALVRGDEEGARAVIAGDLKTDQLARQIEKQALNMIALRMPLAGDLREVFAALKIAMLMAQMGDGARNIAFRAPMVAGCRSCGPVKLIQAMEAEVSAMVKAALDAFVRRSAASAIDVRDRDDAIDEYHACTVQALTAFMADNPEQIGAAVHLLFVTHKLERIGDHAACIAGVVHFAATGAELPAEVPGNAPLEIVG